MNPIRSVDIRATVTKTEDVLDAELDIIAPCFDGVRCGLGYSDGTSIRANGDDPTDPYYLTKFDETADRICSANMYWMLILGSDAPNWANWYNYFNEASFDQKNRPPISMWSTQVTDYNYISQYVVQKYVNNGHRGTDRLFVQLCNEPGHKYTNDGRNYPALTYSAPYSGLSDGQWDTFGDVGERNIIDQLDYFANNLALPEHVKVIAPPLGCTPARFVEELDSFYSDYFDFVDYSSLNCYHTTTALEALDTHRWLKDTYDQIMYSADMIDYKINFNGGTIKPMVLSEWGGNLGHLQLAVAPNLSWGFRKAGERLSILEDKLMSSGRFIWLNFFCGWERDAGVADSATFALVDHDATTYNARFEAFLQKAGRELPETTYRTIAGEPAIT